MIRRSFLALTGLLLAGTARAEGLLELYAACPALHQLLVVEGLRVTPADRVQAFDLRMVSAIRVFLAHGGLPIRRANHDVAAFVIYNSVRATMLARLLESPARLDDTALVEELSDLVVSYLIGTPAPAAAQSAGSPRGKLRRQRPD